MKKVVFIFSLLVIVLFSSCTDNLEESLQSETQSNLDEQIQLEINGYDKDEEPDRE